MIAQKLIFGVGRRGAKCVDRYVFAATRASERVLFGHPPLNGR